MQILKIIFIILEVVVLFNMLIFVHELGHFLAARWRGLKIDRFCHLVWQASLEEKDQWCRIRPRLHSCRRSYVALPQMAPMEMIEGKGEATAEPLPAISALDKIIVALAGPLFSFGLAVFFLPSWSPSSAGPSARQKARPPSDTLRRDGPADKVGLHPGDQILEINNLPVTKFSGIGDSVMWRVVSSEGEKLEVKVKRGDGNKNFFIPLRSRIPRRHGSGKVCARSRLAPQNLPSLQ